MPELLPISEEELVKISVDCYTKFLHVKKGDCFDTKEDLKIALYTKCVEDGYQLVVDRSTKDRFEIKCRHDKKCTWRMIAKRIKDCEMFEVRTFIDQHTCSRTQLYPHHRQANKKVLDGFLVELMFVKGRVYRGHEIMTDMNARFKINISYSQAWRAKCYALELLRGSPEDSFAQLAAYCHNSKLKNPGSITHIKTDRDGRFELLFIAIGAAIRSFVSFLRPVIIVDGVHLKGRYLETNLLVVGMDANNGILPIAYGVEKSETSESWTWFMGHLSNCIDNVSNLTIISDRANSIDMAIRRCFPNAFHGLCACARTLQEVGFESGQEYTHLEQETLEHRVTPWTEKKIAKRVVKSTSWRVEPCSNTLFQVIDHKLNGLVDLDAKTCTCGK
uniref:uncharacterized protein LOC122592104 n=1 Tax=Erigeron canadensis TaxID=72917 RepID=UPI001CB9CF55|nr:uncharacterized protein LOC122592104 [Erigeron canadensis]